MVIKQLVNASEISEDDLTDVKYWKPIIAEINKILEQRAILKANVSAVGEK